MSLIIINSTCKLNKMQIRIYMTWSQKKALLANSHLLQTQILVKQNYFLDEKKIFHSLLYKLSHQFKKRHILFILFKVFSQVIACFISILYLTVDELA